MTVWLGRQEAVAQFRAYLDYVIALDPSIPPDNEIDEDNVGEMEEPAHTDLSPQSTHSITIKPAFPHTDFNTLTTDFKAPNFLAALSTFIHCLIPPPALPILPNLMDRFDIYKHITILQPSNPAARFLKSVHRLRATPFIAAKGRAKAVPAHFNMVLVHVADVNENQHTRGTCLEGMCSLIHLLL